jgi:hypothetical protein
VDAKELARQVNALRHRLGRNEAARVLEIHPTSLDGLLQGRTLRRNTMTLLIERLEALDAAKAKETDE